MVSSHGSFDDDAPMYTSLKVHVLGISKLRGNLSGAHSVNKNRVKFHINVGQKTMRLNKIDKLY